MKFAKYCATRTALVVAMAVLAAAISCNKTPTAPTPEPPPPAPPSQTANPPSLTCVEGISRATVNAAGMAVNFETPPVTDGHGSVSVSCSPPSGETFPVGTTGVTCTATDSLNRTGTCSFNVTVAKIPQVSAIKYLAFGDSITSGEVTVPIGSLLGGSGSIFKHVVVPSASYPAVLLRTLQGRYGSQAGAFVVSNYGLSGEKAANARDRYLAAVNATAPEVLLLLHGHNDIPGGLDGAASSAAREIEVMVEDAKRRGIRVFLATVCPARSSGSRPIDQRFLDDFNSRIRTIVVRQGVTLVDVNAALATDVNRYIGVDGLHPTEAGYARIADTFFQAIQNALEVR